MAVIKPLSRHRIHDDGSPHGIGEGLQFMKSAVHGSLRDTDPQKFLLCHGPAFFLCGRIHLVNGNQVAVFDGRIRHFFHLYIDEIGRAPLMSPCPAEHGQDIFLHHILRHNPFGSGNMTAPLSVSPTQTGTHLHTVQQLTQLLFVNLMRFDC